MENYREQAIAYFKEGYNCAQSVVLVFADVLNADKETALKIAASFGGGMGRLREVCGAVSGAFMAAGLLLGDYGTEDKSAKTLNYKIVQEIAARFNEKNGSIICRELLSIPDKDNPIPSDRTEAYYQKRPCAELVGDAAEIFAEVLALYKPELVDKVN